MLSSDQYIVLYSELADRRFRDTSKRELGEFGSVHTFGRLLSPVLQIFFNFS